MELENISTEYKREYTENIKKTIIAFANTLDPASVPATETMILNMIKETSGDSYEEVRSLEQDLTFDVCKKEFEMGEVKLEKEQMRSLGFIGEDGLYSNLALLVSDQCVHTIKAAVFQGTTKEVFKTRFEFTGSIFKQLRECFDFIDRYNNTRAEINGLARIDQRDYPQIALREALLNAIVHRDYSFSASTLISIFDNRIEIVTMGGLLRGISMDDIMLGVSALRNKNLANVFYRLKLVEAYGTGVLKIMESYEGSMGVKPLIETSDNAFKITLFSTNVVEGKTGVKRQKGDDAEKKILDLFETKEEIQRKDIENLLSISQTMAVRYLKALVAKNILERVGGGRSSRYVVKRRKL